MNVQKYHLKLDSMDSSKYVAKLVAFEFNILKIPINL